MFRVLYALIWLIALPSAHAASSGNWPALLKANLFSFEIKVENIMGKISCGNYLSPSAIAANDGGNRIQDIFNRIGDDVVNDLEKNGLDVVFPPLVARPIAPFTPSNWLKELATNDMGLVAKLEFDRAWDLQQLDMEKSAGHPDEKREKLTALKPAPAQPFVDTSTYEPRRKVEYLNYLVEEFTKLEKSAILTRELWHLNRSQGREVENLAFFHKPGDEGRAIRLILFLFQQMQDYNLLLEEGYVEFAEQFFADEKIISHTYAPQNIELTRRLLNFIHQKDMFLYGKMIAIFTPHISEPELMGYGLHQTDEDHQ